MDSEKFESEGNKLAKIGHAVREVFSPQIKEFSEAHYEYLKDISTNAAVLIAGVVAVWSSDFVFILWLGILGLILLAFSFFISFIARKRSITLPVDYIISLRKLSREFTEYSHKIVMFSRGEIESLEYKNLQEDFNKNYHKMRDSVKFSNLEQKEFSVLQRIPKWYSEVNIATYLLFVGMVFILLSFLLPNFF